jgi:HSP20 family protein
MRSPLWRPPTDVYEIEEAIVIRVEIAGMQEEDFSISLAERLLTIRGVRPDIQEKRAYHQMEIFFGEFLCEVELLSPVDAEAVTAEYQAGFLRVILPKLRAKRVQISD